MHPRVPRRLAATMVAVGLVAGLAACGDDDGNGEEAPVLTNEFGVETFEPGDDTFVMPETFEPNS